MCLSKYKLNSSILFGMRVSNFEVSMSKFKTRVSFRNFIKISHKFLYLGTNLPQNFLKPSSKFFENFFEIKVGKAHFSNAKK